MLFVVSACATGRIETMPDAMAPAADAASDRGGVVLDANNGSDATDAPADSGFDAFDAGCSTSDAGLGGIGVPNGTTASASSSWSTSTPDKSIDNDLGTGWNAGGYSGSLRITFPAPQALNGVRFASAASPASSETYTIYGYQNSVPAMIGSATLNVPNGIAVLAPINVMVGNYDEIRIDVAAQSSWASIVEVSVLTPNCP